MTEFKELEDAEMDEMSADGKTGVDEFEQMFTEANAEGIKCVLGDGAMVKGGLTPEQEQTLYEKGVIPPATTGNPALDTLAEWSTGVKVVGTVAAPKPKKLSKIRKFPLPKSPLPWHMQMKNRYHPVLMQTTRLIMRHGKLSRAQYVGTPE
jgi:hypothetical protein